MTSEIVAQRGSDSCDFCRIAKGEREGIWLVCEDDDTLAFFPDRPAVNGHVLVIPRRHSRDIWDIDEAQCISVMRTVLSVSRAIRRALQPEGLNIIHSSGTAAGQSVDHIHFHLVPRWSEDAMGELWPESPPIPVSKKDGTLAAIRSALVQSRFS